MRDIRRNMVFVAGPDLDVMRMLKLPETIHVKRDSIFDQRTVLQFFVVLDRGWLVSLFPPAFQHSLFREHRDWQSIFPLRA